MIYYIKSTGYIFWIEKRLKSLTFRAQFNLNATNVEQVEQCL